MATDPPRPHRLRPRQAGIWTFCDQASPLLACGEVLKSERHGKTIGYFIPVSAGGAAAARRALAELNEAVAAVVAAGLVDEEGLSQALDPSEPR